MNQVVGQSGAVFTVGGKGAVNTSDFEKQPAGSSYRKEYEAVKASLPQQYRNDDALVDAAIEKYFQAQIGPNASVRQQTQARGEAARQAVAEFEHEKTEALNAAELARLTQASNPAQGQSAIDGFPQPGDISLAQYATISAARGAEVAAAGAAGPDLGTLLLDLTQMTLDIVGIFDPIGLSDGANALISAGRGDWVGAGLSALAIVPVVGALATAGKFGKWAETVAKAVELAATNPAARQALQPLLQKLNDAIGAIPDAVMRNLPAEMRSTLEGLKTQLDDFLGVANRSFSNGVEAVADRLGISPERVQAILDTPKGDRPPPVDYVPANRIAEHAASFENGGSRFTLQSSIDRYGLGQRDGTTFIMTRAEADQLLRDTGGDPRRLEQALGLPEGQLDNAQLVRVDFTPEAMDDLGMRMPSGNEAGANDQWLPGGLLPSGTNEAVIDGAKAQPHHYSITAVD